jgi:hypothetical protein
MHKKMLLRTTVRRCLLPGQLGLERPQRSSKRQSLVSTQVNRQIPYFYLLTDVNELPKFAMRLLLAPAKRRTNR